MLCSIQTALSIVHTHVLVVLELESFDRLGDLPRMTFTAHVTQTLSLDAVIGAHLLRAEIAVRTTATPLTRYRLRIERAAHTTTRF